MDVYFSEVFLCCFYAFSSNSQVGVQWNLLWMISTQASSCLSLSISYQHSIIRVNALDFIKYHFLLPVKPSVCLSTPIFWNNTFVTEYLFERTQSIQNLFFFFWRAFPNLLWFKPFIPMGCKVYLNFSANVCLCFQFSTHKLGMSSHFHFKQNSIISKTFQNRFWICKVLSVPLQIPKTFLNYVTFCVTAVSIN